jgi:hypothetical protein
MRNRFGIGDYAENRGGKNTFGDDDPAVIMIAARAAVNLAVKPRMTKNINWVDARKS